MNPLVKNSETGFLESLNPSLAGFTSIKKLRFLALAYEMAENGEMPGVQALSKLVGITSRCFYEHLTADSIFKEQWDEALRVIEERLVSVMVSRGQEKGGFMDRIAWLRAYSPKRWNNDRNVQIVHDTSAQQRVINAVAIEIDPEVPDIQANSVNSKGISA
jgi:hypothetical protein